MGVIITIISYAFQVFCICAISAVICLMTAGLLRVLKVKLSKRAAIICLVVIFLILCVVLAYICQNPIVSCPDEYTDIITADQLRNVQSIASGVYSKQLPLIPVHVNIENVQWAEMFGEYEIKFRIDYLFFGNVKLVIGGDGVSVVKPLGGR